MFKTIKKKVDIVEVISKELKVQFKKVGDNTFEPEDRTCPFCTHKDCFKIKSTGEETDYYHCFSCEEHGDVIKFIEKSRDIKPVEAARILAREWQVSLPNDYSPIQDIFNLAAQYYHNCLTTTCNKHYAELNMMTPMEYQTTIRKRKSETVGKFLIGWSDGGLMTYLKGLGYEEELLSQTGLMNKKGGDFLPAKAFIYPHFVINRVSHFTFKDPLKQHAYQLKNSNKLNNHLFYNSDSLHSCQTIAIVEGENDLLSIDETGWKEGLIATIGQISAQQLEWIENNLANKHVVTFFDPDSAGDKYRDKVEKLRSKFASLKQIKLNSDDDIDEFLSAGGKLQTVIETCNVTKEITELEEQDISDDEVPSQINIAEKAGAYFKFKYKDNLPIPAKLTNFTIRLKNIFIKGMEREREVILIREDGSESGPVTVSSDCKVSLKPFKSFVANTIDGSFYGTENDLIAMWEYVYSKGVEKLVYVPTTVGRLEEHRGWLFRDLFISDTGQVIRPDEEEIVWFPGKTIGLKAMSLNVGQNGKSRQEAIDVPVLISTNSEEDNRELLKSVVHNLCKNLGDTGMALTILGWAKANVYSNLMFKKVQGFPFLFFWGKHGQGKTVIAKWIAAIFNMDESGYATLPQLKSGVGFGRKISYYASLPVIMDEIRADASTIEQYGNIRSWYQRAGRDLGVKESFGIKKQDIKSNFIFAGQDQFTDAATRQRCIALRIPATGREQEMTYRWIEQRKNQLSAIGYHWIIESTRVNEKELVERYDRLDKQLVENGCEARSAKNWACVGIFAKTLADEFVPNFNYYEYLFRVSKEDTKDQKEDDVVSKFFSIVEMLQARENSPFSSEHMRVENGKILIYYDAVFGICELETRGLVKENFTMKAVREALKEEPYFVEDSTKKFMGVNKTRHRVIILDLQHPETPLSLQNIGHNSAK